MKRTLALCLFILVAGCGGSDPVVPGDTPIAAGQAGTIARASAATASVCAACIVDLTVTRAPGPPNTEVRHFAADPARRYRMTIDLPGDGSPAWVVLNGATLVEPGTIPPGGGTQVFDDLALPASNALSVRLAGVPGRSVRVRIEAIGSELASCPPWAGAPEALFTTSLAPLAQLIAIQPLGRLGPPLHTLPTHHTYWNSPTLLDASSQPIATGPIDVTAPGPMHLVALQFSEQSNDFKVILRPCLEVAMYVDHVKRLSPAVRAAYEAARRYEVPGARIALLELSLAPGDAIGVGGDARFVAGVPDGSIGIDVGLIDLRRSERPFANPARYRLPDDAGGIFPPSIPPADVALIIRDLPPDRLHQFCPLDYFAAPVRDAYRALLGDLSGSPRRTIEPRCGDLMQDMPGTLQGAWFEDKPANGFGPDYSNDSNEERLLAFAPDHVDPGQLVLSIGLGVEQPTGSPIAWTIPAGTFLFGPPLSSGLVNRAFADVVPEATYCYQGVFPQFGTPTPLAGVVLVEVSAAELWIARLPSAPSCAAVSPTLRLSASAIARRYVR